MPENTQPPTEPLRARIAAALTKLHLGHTPDCIHCRLRVNAVMEVVEPEIQRIREQVAADIEAAQARHDASTSGPASPQGAARRYEHRQAMARAARIARGEDPDA